MLAHLDAWLSAPRDADNGGAPGAGRATHRSLDIEHTIARDANRLDAIRHGSVPTFEQLFFEHATPLRRFVRGMTRSEAVAEDVVQDVFAQLWEQRHTIVVKSTLRAYLYAAARGRALTFLRARGVRESYSAQVVTDDVTVVPAQAPDALAAIEREELTRALGDALATLPPRARQVAELRWFGKLSHAEIAAVMGIAPATVNNQLTTALRTLRERLRDYLE